MARMPNDDGPGCSVVLEDAHFSHLFHSPHALEMQCSNLYACQILRFCPLWQRDPSSVAFPQRSSNFFWVLWVVCPWLE